MQQAADLCICHGGNMGIRRIIIPAIVALGAAGSILAGSTVPAVAAQASSVHVQASAVRMVPHSWYHM